jgi:RNAse (barnase) inhibitor barstar
MESGNLNYYSADNIRYVFIDGNTCDTIEKCYITLAQQLSIPDYFGYNLDALEEVLADLEWIEEEKIIIIVLNSGALLDAEPDLKDDFLSILNTSDNVRVEVKGLPGNQKEIS